MTPEQRTAFQQDLETWFKGLPLEKQARIKALYERTMKEPHAPQAAPAAEAVTAPVAPATEATAAPAAPATDAAMQPAPDMTAPQPAAPVMPTQEGTVAPAVQQ